MLLTHPADAHPMGNFAVAHATSLQLDGRFLRVRYRIDLAEIPSAGEIRQIDADGDGRASAAEIKAYLDRTVPKLSAGQTLRLNGRTVPMEVISSTLHQRPGAADVPTLLVTVDYLVTVEREGSLVVEYSDSNWPGRAGWREISARAWQGWLVTNSEVPAESPTGLLEEYPTDVNAVPPQQTSARVVFEPAESGMRSVAVTASAAPRPKGPSTPLKEGLAAAHDGSPSRMAWFGSLSIILAAAIALSTIVIVRRSRRRTTT